MLRRLIVRSEVWPLSRPFRISRGVKTAAEVMLVQISEGACVGRGESVPYARYGESTTSVLAEIESVRAALEAGMTRQALQTALPHGAARNAIDCALWDLEAKLAGRSVAQMAGVAVPESIATAVTVSLAAPAEMGTAAAALASAPLIKVKVDANDPLEKVAAVRAAAPNARLIIDPNESWSFDLLRRVLPDLAALGAHLIEQPLPAAEDETLEGFASPVSICADESAHTHDDLDRIARRYQAVNIKLDKAGGLTQALVMQRRAKELGLATMVGCMVCTSLGVAPALLLAGDAAFVDLDGPWWLANDRAPALKFRDGIVYSVPALWGG